MEQKPEGEKTPRRSRKFLVIYACVLFTVACGLILVSYLSSQKAQREVQTLNEQLTTAQGSLKKMEAISELVDSKDQELRELRENLDTLRQEATRARGETVMAQGEAALAKRSTEAAGELWKLEKEMRERKYSAAKKRLSALEESGLAALLDAEGQEELAALKDRLY